MKNVKPLHLARVGSRLVSSHPDPYSSRHLTSTIPASLAFQGEMYSYTEDTASHAQWLRLGLRSEPWGASVAETWTQPLHFPTPLTGTSYGRRKENHCKTVPPTPNTKNCCHHHHSIGLLQLTLHEPPFNNYFETGLEYVACIFAFQTLEAYNIIIVELQF